MMTVPVLYLSYEMLCTTAVVTQELLRHHVLLRQLDKVESIFTLRHLSVVLLSFSFKILFEDHNTIYWMEDKIHTGNGMNTCIRKAC